MKKYNIKVMASILAVIGLILPQMYFIVSAESVDVRPIEQEKNWCWSTSGQMMVNTGLKSLDIQERALGYSQEALNLSGGPTTYQDFLQVIVDKNATLPAGDKLISEDEIEQAMITYIAKAKLDYVGGTEQDIAKSLLYVLESAGKNNYTVVDLAIKSNNIDKSLWTNLNARFIKESLKMGFPVAFNKDDNHWRLISGIEGDTISIQETGGQKATNNNSINDLLNNKKDYGYLLHINGVWKDEYLGTPLLLTGALDNDPKVKKDPNRSLNIQIACSDSKVTLVSANGEKRNINLTALQPYSKDSGYALMQEFYLDDKAAYLSNKKNIYIGEVAIENPGMYKLISGTSTGNYNDPISNAYSFEVVDIASVDSGIINNYSNSSSSGYSSGSQGGHSSNSPDINSKAVETVFGEKSVSSDVPVIITYKMNSQNAMIDSKKAFAGIINSQQNKAVNFVTSNATWSFESKYLNKEPSQLYNFDATVSVKALPETVELPKNLTSILSNKKSEIVSFAKKGILPGTAKVKVNLGDNYKNKEVYIYYFYNNGQSSNLQLISKSVRVDEKGCTTFQLNHGCDFIIIEKSDAITIEANLNLISNSKNQLNK